MGLSFHYSGEINDKDKLPELIDEVKTLAQTHHWKYEIYNTDFSQKPINNEDIKHKLYGVSFTPSECEEVHICFLENGKMSNLVNLIFWSDPKKPEEKEYLYMMSVKTQYAGVEIHAVIIDFFRYISNKYLTSFYLSDEGQYWETNDKNVLKEQFERYNAIIDTFKLAIDSIPADPNEDLINYIERIAERTNKHINSKDNNTD
jgi:hypothetical protein